MTEWKNYTMFKLQFSSDFYEDLAGTKQYITCDLDNPSAANRLLDRVSASLKQIKENPFLYPVYHNKKITSNKYRYAVISKHLLIYSVDESEKVVCIARFIYGGRNIPNLI